MTQNNIMAMEVEAGFQQCVENFDALLADLEQTIPKRPPYPREGLDHEPAPPVPPPPAPGAINGTADTGADFPPPPSEQQLADSLHEGQFAHVSHSHASSPHNPGPTASPGPLYQSYNVQPQLQYQHAPQQFAASSYAPKPYQPKTMSSSLNNNLSELDSLLADLNAAQGSGDLNSAAGSLHVSTSPPHGSPANNKKIPPPVKAKPKKGISDIRPDVDSLLDELQNAVPTGANSPGQRASPYNDHAPQPLTAVISQAPPQHASPSPVSSGGQSSPRPRTASSATKELDDLMASLSDFRMQSTTQVTHVQVGPDFRMQSTTQVTHVQPQPMPAPPAVVEDAYATPNKARSPTSPGPGGEALPRGSQLDTMLSNLQSDMSRQGVQTVQKGQCAACSKPIVGQIVTALGRTWHPEHFTCKNCNGELGTQNFFERDGTPFCEECYHNLFSPRCGYCNGPILDKCVTALENTWHPEHFFCNQCGRPFGQEGFHEKDGKAYCYEDYFDMFAPKCGGCNKAIVDNYISALNGHWHPGCFVCRECLQPFHGGSFFDHDGQPYCEIHYHAKRGSLCSGCQKPITGRCITAMSKKFHPEHFVCAFCLKQLNKGTFKEQNDKPYCHPCFVKLFG
ncbi:paxillin-like isoform X3 [Branchiostoma lanceolatum]|uniref:paxillin-like isoform X3 n=1 Tax=Branchiostoma lanceolatum TaxID=7740 RepID=UPI0034520031